MLDLLPAEVWSNPDYRWLDPCCKSGAILREIAARLLAGLEAWEPDFGNRREHIFRNMLFGTSVTELTGQVVRRSVYCSRDATGERSVVRFAQPAGNIPRSEEHTSELQSLMRLSYAVFCLNKTAKYIHHVITQYN